MIANAQESLGHSFPAGPQPNTMDRRRIERALVDRKRYRYVDPIVTEVDNGYLIRSACCSRTVDADGGIIDIALLQYVAVGEFWRLYRPDRAAGEWQVHDCFGRLVDALDVVRDDPLRLFWR